MDMKQMSIVTARRLKAMRLKKGKSHAVLSRELKEKYNIDISRNSLMNYEASDQHHTKAYKNNGMKVEYLRILADYYGVSTDWLLGLTNIEVPDGNARQACSYTGLSPRNIEYFHNWTAPGLHEGKAFLLFFNSLLENQDFQILVDHIYDFYCSIMAGRVFQMLLKKYANAKRKIFMRAIDDILNRPDLAPRFHNKLLEHSEHYIDAMSNADSLQMPELYAYRASQDLTVLLRELETRFSPQSPN